MAETLLLFSTSSSSSGKKNSSSLANWDFPNIHPFVNDWMAKIVHHIPLGQRNPAQHPYAKEVLLWRIWNQLQRTDEPDYQLLYAYIGNAPLSRGSQTLRPRGENAQLSMTIRTSRPRLLRDWEQALNTAATEPQFAWQPRLRRALIARKSRFLPAPQSAHPTRLDDEYGAASNLCPALGLPPLNPAPGLHHVL